MTDTTDGEPPLVTLALKTFNQEDMVAEAIEAAFAQTFAPLEILLSDDCSSDGTFATMERMARRYRGPHRVVLNRNATNLGIVAHWNRIAEMASGRLLVEAAGDDISEPGRIEKLVSAWTSGAGRVRAVHSAFMEIDEHGKPLGRAEPDRRIIDGPGRIRSRCSGHRQTASAPRQPGTARSSTASGPSPKTARSRTACCSSARRCSGTSPMWTSR